MNRHFSSAVAALIFLCVAAQPASPQMLPANSPAVASRSGQFMIYGIAPQTYRPYAPDLATNLTLIQLDPALLTVSCERIKQALLTTLQSPDSWRGKIYVVLHPARNAAEDIVVTTSRFGEGWNYRIDSPDSVEPARFVRAMTQVLLLEIASRNTHEQAATLPAWLAEGLPQLLLDNSEIDLVLQPAQATGSRTLPARREMRDSRPGDLLKLVREQLHGHAPLMIDELGRAPANWNSEAGDVYRASARLFLHELLELRDGGASLFAMLPELPFDPDWRVAFLRGFHGHFQRLVDLEKWWALQSVYAIRHTPDRTWTSAEILKKLDELLRCSLQVQTATNEPAFYTDASLQTVIQGWDYRQQSLLLHQKIEVLAALKLRANADLSGLVEQYRSALQTYLQKMEGEATDTARQELTGRHPAGHPTATSGVPAPDNPAVLAVVAQLNTLDARRVGLKMALEKGR